MTTTNYATIQITNSRIDAMTANIE